MARTAQGDCAGPFTRRRHVQSRHVAAIQILHAVDRGRRAVARSASCRRPVRTTADIEPAFEGFARAPNGGLILPTDSFTNLRSSLIIDLAARHRLPAISAYERFPKDGGLMYYGASINVPDQFRQAATYIDRILKHVKPGDLPIQRADKDSLD